MSVVIVGGHDRMVRQYMDICKKYNWDDVVEETMKLYRRK